MSALLEAETLTPIITLATRRLGKRPSPATIWRWVRKGVKGVKLEAVSVSGGWYSTPEAFTRFIERQTEAAFSTETPDVPAGRTPATEAKLRAAGLL